MRAVTNLFSQVYSFCKDDEVVAAFLRIVLTAEATNEGEDLHFHNKIYSEALENALQNEAVEKALLDNPADHAQRESGNED